MSYLKHGGTNALRGEPHFPVVSSCVALHFPLKVQDASLKRRLQVILRPLCLLSFSAPATSLLFF